MVSTGTDGLVVTQVRSGHTAPLQTTTLTFVNDTATTTIVETDTSIVAAAAVKTKKIKEAAEEEEETEKVM